MALVPRISGRDNYFGNANYLPSIIPDTFPNMDFFIILVEKMFYKEIKNIEILDIIPKHDVDKEKALKTINTILRSFTKEHNDKIRGCAYLMNMWFDIVK
jgi:hypothetical protein